VAPAGTEGSRLLVGTVFVTFAVAVANTTSGAIAQPEIADAFGAGAADVGAIVFGYSTSFAIMTAIYGSLARRFGLGSCLTFGVVLVAVGAAMAVLASDLGMLIAARVLQGVGAGAIPTLSMSLIARRLSGPARARALGINVAAVGIGFAGGPLFGGLLLEAFGWRGAMAIGLLVAPAAFIFPRLAPEPGDPKAPLDVPGMLLLAVAVGALVSLVNRLPVLGLGEVTGGMVLVGVVAFALLIVRSRRRLDPAWPRIELRDPVLRRAMLLGCIGQTAFFGVLVLAPIVAARAHGIGGFRLGLLLLPMAVLIAVISPRNGIVAERIGRRATTAVSMSVIALGAGILAWQGPGAPVPLLEVGLVVAGSGFGLLSAPLVHEVSRRFPDARRSVALGAYNLAFFIGSASGGAIATGFVQSGIELEPFAGRPLPGASTGLLLLAVVPLVVVAYDRLRPVDGTSAAAPIGPPSLDATVRSTDNEATASRMRP
jgi:MFS family permease